MELSTLEVIEVLVNIITSLLISGAVVIVIFAFISGLLEKINKKTKKRRTSVKPLQWRIKQSKIAKTRKRDWHGRFIKAK